MIHEKDTETTIIHQNARYKVFHVHASGVDAKFDEASNEVIDYYAVYNKEYGVEEVWTTQLPEAISAAESLDLAMETEPWVKMRDLTLGFHASGGDDPFGNLDFSFDNDDDLH